MSNILSQGMLDKNEIQLLMEDEVFTQIKRWNQYYISNYGRLIRRKKKGVYSIVKPSERPNGYLVYTLSKPARTYRGEKIRNLDGTTKTNRASKQAQRLTAEIYVKNPYSEDEYTLDDLQVHHKDKNPQNNYYKNLMWLCKSKNGRKDHDFIHQLKKVSLYNQETATFHSYKDIETLLRRLDVDVLEFIDSVRLNDKLFKSQDGKWDVYHINNEFVGVQFQPKQQKKKKKKNKNKN